MLQMADIRLCLDSTSSQPSASACILKRTHFLEWIDLIICTEFLIGDRIAFDRCYSFVTYRFLLSAASEPLLSRSKPLKSYPMLLPGKSCLSKRIAQTTLNLNPTRWTMVLLTDQILLQWICQTYSPPGLLDPMSFHNTLEFVSSIISPTA